MNSSFSKNFFGDIKNIKKKLKLSHNQEKPKGLQDLFDEHLDILYYLEDIYDLQILKLNQVLVYYKI